MFLSGTAATAMGVYACESIRSLKQEKAQPQCRKYGVNPRAEVLQHPCGDGLTIMFSGLRDSAGSVQLAAVLNQPPTVRTTPLSAICAQEEPNF